jgi:hypothetical protein
MGAVRRQGRLPYRGFQPQTGGRVDFLSAGSERCVGRVLPPGVVGFEATMQAAIVEALRYRPTKPLLFLISLLAACTLVACLPSRGVDVRRDKAGNAGTTMAESLRKELLI